MTMPSVCLLTLYDQDAQLQLWRRPTGTLEVSIDEEGTYGTVTLSHDQRRQLARELLAGLPTKEN
jgi:phage head maturation protease